MQRTNVTWDDLELICKIVGPLLTVIVGLIILSYKNMQKTQEKTISALEAHVISDEKIHDRLFTDLRTNEGAVAHLGGEFEEHTRNH